MHVCAQAGHRIKRSGSLKRRFALIALLKETPHSKLHSTCNLHELPMVCKSMVSSSVLHTKFYTLWQLAAPEQPLAGPVVFMTARASVRDLLWRFRVDSPAICQRRNPLLSLRQFSASFR